MRFSAIYLDMDGVLADFDGAIAARGLSPECNYIHLPPSQWTAEQRRRDALVREVMEEPDFWPNIPNMLRADELIAEGHRLVGRDRLFILTATPRLTNWRDRIAEQKKEWAARHLQFRPSHVITCLRYEKQKWAAHDAILIDDMEANCAEWAAAGGIAIHHRDVDTTIAELRGLAAMSRTMEQDYVDHYTTAKRAEAALAAADPRMTAAEAVIDWIKDHPTESMVGIGDGWGLSAMRLTDDSVERKRTPMAAGLLDYFPDALAAVAGVSFIGNEKHNPGEPLHWSRGKSNDHADCIMRHLVDRGARDGAGVRHSAALAWRALALLQEEIESERGLPPSRGSRAHATV